MRQNAVYEPCTFKRLSFSLRKVQKAQRVFPFG